MPSWPLTRASLLSLTGLVPDQLLAAEAALAKAVVPVAAATSWVAGVVGGG